MRDVNALREAQYSYWSAGLETRNRERDYRLRSLREYESRTNITMVASGPNTYDLRALGILIVITLEQRLKQ